MRATYSTTTARQKTGSLQRARRETVFLLVMYTGVKKWRLISDSTSEILQLCQGISPVFELETSKHHPLMCKCPTVQVPSSMAERAVPQ
jgi:hypothetical protein